MIRVTRIATAVVLLTGFALTADGAWMFAKAKLAQLLLEMTWRLALEGKAMKPWPWADTRAIARLTIERDGTRVVVLEGASGRTMAFGPGHVDGTALPGMPGNCVLSAHRDTHFAALQGVTPGDMLALQRPDGITIRYKVKGTMVTDQRNISLLRQDERTRLTLVTCYPFDAIVPGGPMRFVVIAEAVP
jgi:sortase A